MFFKKVDPKKVENLIPKVEQPELNKEKQYGGTDGQTCPSTCGYSCGYTCGNFCNSDWDGHEENKDNADVARPMKPQ